VEQSSMSPPNLCECGCGRETKGKKFIRGHNMRGKNSHMFGKTGENNPFFGKRHSEETKARIGAKNRGRKPSEETRKKMSKSRMGRKSWNEGLTKETDPRLKRHSEVLKGTKHTPEAKKKMSEVRMGEKNHFFGKKHTRNSIKKMSESKKGQIAWNRGLTKNTDTRIKRYSGENHPCWKGGIANYPYGVTWTKELKVLIKERDNYACQVCGNTKRWRLTVHHIDYVKMNCNPSNLITLCKNCNGKANYDRPFWKAYFSQLIQNYEKETKLYVQSQIPQ